MRQEARPEQAASGQADLNLRLPPRAEGLKPPKGKLRELEKTALVLLQARREERLLQPWASRSHALTLADLQPARARVST